MIDEAGNFRAMKLLQNRINARVRLEARLEISEQPDSIFGTPGKKEFRFGRRRKLGGDLPIADAAGFWLWRGWRRRPDPLATCEAQDVVWFHGVTVGAARPVRLGLRRRRLRLWGRFRRMLFDCGGVNVE
jgi:hypothetical protein